MTPNTFFLYRNMHTCMHDDACCCMLHDHMCKKFFSSFSLHEHVKNQCENPMKTCSSSVSSEEKYIFYTRVTSNLVIITSILVMNAEGMHNA